jgi:conjugative transposon TraJ protein
MYRKFLSLLSLFCLLLAPGLAHAQVSTGINQLHTVLDDVYNQMIPLCANVIEVCQAVAGLGTIFYIGARVWKHLAHAEPVDFYPLLRPFVMVILIGMFPQVLAIINGILYPTVTATAAMVDRSNEDVNTLLEIEAHSIVDSAAILLTPNSQGSHQGWDKYTQPDATTSGSGGSIWDAIGSGFKFLAGGIEASLRYVFRFLLSIILQVLYFAASLCIDTVRVFHLIVLAILGPFAFAFSCYDGFQTSLTHWLGKYINIYLWLPISNLLAAILSQIQYNMLNIDLARAKSGDISLFSATDIAYLIFLIIGVVAYTTVPGLANYIVHSHLPNPLNQKISGMAKQVGSAAVMAATGGASGGAGGGAMASGMSGGGGKGGGGDVFETNSKGQPYDPYQYNRDKISG